MRTKLFANLLIAGCLASPVLAQPRNGDNDQLDAARELYASARYDEALALLNNLRPAGGATDRRSIEQYRSLCLLALGRGQEAEAAIAAVVNADPLFQPSEAEASPRVRAAFSDVRRRLLPDIVAAKYGAAKAAFDRKEYPIAERQFRELLTLLNDPDMGGKLGDMKILATGFLDLAVAANTPPPEPPKSEVAPVTPPPPPVQQAQPPPAKIFGADDFGISIPISLRQTVPNVPAGITGQIKDHGRVEVVIDEQGRVTFAAIRQPMHPLYDQLLLAAARDWKYRPALMNGVPVKYRKTILISVSR